jgi:sigma-B regulation protein RsbU (phosphoserine phosphatase)
MDSSEKDRTFTAGVRLGREKLKAVLMAGSTLNSTLNLNEVLTAILNASVEQLGAETGTVFLLSDDEINLISRIVEHDNVKELIVPSDKGLAGATFIYQQILNIPDPYSDERFDRSYDEMTGYKTRNILSIPMINRQGSSIGVIQVLNKKQGSFNEDDEDFASILATFAAIAVENAKQIQFTIERERLEKEFSLARKIQSSFLQGEIPDFPGYDISAVSDPCYQIGGDYMRLARLGADEYLLIAADVSGKGIPAALITLALHAYINMLLPTQFGGFPDGIAVSSREEYPRLLNTLLQTVTAGRSFVTLCGSILNGKTGEMLLCNCGHNSPVIIHADGSWEKMDSTTPVLGLLPEIKPCTVHVKLQPGDSFIMYTDGIVEAAKGEGNESGDRDEFGSEHLIELIVKNRKKSAKEISRIVIKEVEEFISGYHKEDDLTLIILKKKGL